MSRFIYVVVRVQHRDSVMLFRSFSRFQDDKEKNCVRMIKKRIVDNKIWF